MHHATIIFIIDDDIDDQKLLIEIFREIDPDIHCFTASNGQEGLYKLQTDAIPFPTLIILDLNMPRIDGWRCLSELKKSERFKSIPVLIYSTSSTEQDIIELKQAGAIDYFEKEFDLSILKVKLVNILDSHYIT